MLELTLKWSMTLNVFVSHSGSKKRSFPLYDKLKDYAKKAPDYLKYLKSVYGRTIILAWKFDMGV